MRTLCLNIMFCFVVTFVQSQNKKVGISDFQLTNITSPSAMLLEETSTSVDVVENLKTFMLYTANNYGQNLSLEITPYNLFFNFLLEDNKRTYYNYKGLNKDNLGTKKSVLNPFSKIYRNFTISITYADKKFEGFNTEKKSLSIGFRTTLFKLYTENSLKNILQKTKDMADALSGIKIPVSVIQKGEMAIANYVNNNYENIKTEFTKNIKPIFQLDGSLAYATILDTSKKRLGTWLTSQVSLPFNKKDANYINLFLIGRYIEDGFRLNNSNQFENLTYRDFGGKLEIEFGKFSLAYEYIKRNGSISDNKSLGNLEFNVSKNFSISGGFGKDFISNNKRAVLLGINWGLNFNEKPLSF